MRFRAPLGLLCFAFAAGSYGQLSGSPEYSILSCGIDTSNLVISYTTYSAWLSHSGSDPDTYINSIAITGGGSWDSDIDLYTPGSGFDFWDGSSYGTYSFGTPISGDTNWYVGNIASRWSQIFNVDPGVYDFTVDVIGGADSSEMNLITSINFSLEVFDRLDVEVTGDANPGVIHYGDETHVTMSVRNNMANRNFRTETWFYSGGGMTNGGAPLSHVSWDGNWWDHEIAPGDTRTDGHTTWRAEGAIPTGFYVGSMGVVGGLHDGDFHFIPMTGHPPTVELVPEPSGILVLALGGLALLRRKRD